MDSNWAEIINTQGSVGILWHDNGDYGFAASATPENSEIVSLINQRQDILDTETTLPSEIKYRVLFEYINSEHNCLSISSSGDSEEMQALIAAATPKRYSSQDLQNLLQPAGEYSIVYDDDKAVLGLVWENDGNVVVRENGNWVEPNEEDDRLYGGSMRYVNAEATELFDKLVQDETTPTLDLFKEVSLD